MDCAIIDIGSNSVRLMTCDNNIFNKTVITTKLAEGMSEDRLLKDKAMQRTVDALSFLCKKVQNKSNLFVYATAAVRNAKNRGDFLSKVYNECGINVDVLSGESECKVGYVGALGGTDGGVIDIGGASTEIAVVKGGKCAYNKSINIGAVSVKDRCGQSKELSSNYVKSIVNEIGKVPKSSFVAIGGTATSLAAILQELEPYDPKKVDGYKIEKNELLSIKNRLFEMSVYNRKKLKGLSPSRAETIACGASILYELICCLDVDEIVVSEKDNLEGYYKLNVENKVQ